MYKPVISIIIPVRNEGDRIKNTINTFAFGRSTLFHLEFVVVDDASEDGCCTLLENLLSWERDAAIVRVIKLEQWSGIPFARNVGANYAQAPILFITDANVAICQNWDIPLFRHLHPGKVLSAAVADTVSSCIGYGCVLRLPSMGVSWMSNPYEFEGDIPVSACAGTVIYTALFKKLGGYDTSMPLYGAAEPEFSVRLWLYGAQIIICPDLVLWHRFRPAEERNPFIKHIEFLQIKNYLRFALLYLNNSDIKATLHHYFISSPTLFKQAMQYLETDYTIMKRKNHLQKVLLRNFDWYQNKFNN
jgi:glycosyltransferase involved in cell wall biosynthesis